MNLRRAARKDRNHGEIVAALRAHRVPVIDVSGTACGCDILASPLGTDTFIPIEIKDGHKPPSARQLTPTELALMMECRAMGRRYEVVLSAADALEACGVETVI